MSSSTARAKVRLGLTQLFLVEVHLLLLSFFGIGGEHALLHDTVEVRANKLVLPVLAHRPVVRRSSLRTVLALGLQQVPA